MTKSLIQILKTIGPDWALVPVTKANLRIVKELDEEIDQVKLSVVGTFLYLKTDRTIYFGNSYPADYLTYDEAIEALRLTGREV